MHDRYIPEERYIKKFNSYSKKVKLADIERHNKKWLKEQLLENIKLSIELVPVGSWWKNVRNNMKQSEWNRIRYVTYGLSKYRCEICGERGTMHPVECHEVWEYCYETKIQTLKGFQSLCPLCHEVKHIGFAGLMGNRDRAAIRFREVNNYSIEEAKVKQKELSIEWSKRNKIKWTLEYKILKLYNLDVEISEDNWQIRRRK